MKEKKRINIYDIFIIGIIIMIAISTADIYFSEETNVYEVYNISKITNNQDDDYYAIIYISNDKNKSDSISFYTESERHNSYKRELILKSVFIKNSDDEFKFVIDKPKYEMTSNYTLYIPKDRIKTVYLKGDN